MIPRGEVGLIFAAVGRQLRIGGQRAVDDGDLFGDRPHGDRDDDGHAAPAEVLASAGSPAHKPRQSDPVHHVASGCLV